MTSTEWGPPPQWTPPPSQQIPSLPAPPPLSSRPLNSPPPPAERIPADWQAVARYSAPSHTSPKPKTFHLLPHAIVLLLTSLVGVLLGWWAVSDPAFCEGIEPCGGVDQAIGLTAVAIITIFTVGIVLQLLVVAVEVVVASTRKNL